MATKPIRARERTTVIQALMGGVTPRTGLQHIQVGRANEVKTVIKDLEHIQSGGAAIRFIIGNYGSGKSFFLGLIQSIALEQKMVTISADLSPDRRIHASKGQARNLYAELMKNLATRSKPDGNALGSVVERFITSARQEADAEGKEVIQVIQQRLSDLKEWVGGYDFAQVIEQYWIGYDSGNDVLKTNAIRWLRAEYTTKTDAKRDLGVRTIINDQSFYDHLKLFSHFVVQSGYTGLLINLDEMVNLYKIANKQSRTSNYEQILRIFNDCLQGNGGHFGFLLGGTPDFLLDPHRGLYSYEALQSRLAENTFAKQTGLVDYNSPVLNLSNLTVEELYILLKNIRSIFAGGDPEKHLVPDEALHAFQNHCFKKVGEAYFRTPRNTIVAFAKLLSLLEQYPDQSWESVLGTVDIIVDAPSDMPDIVDEESTADDAAAQKGTDGFASFKM